MKNLLIVFPTRLPLGVVKTRCHDIRSVTILEENNNGNKTILENNPIVRRRIPKNGLKIDTSNPLRLSGGFRATAAISRLEEETSGASGGGGGANLGRILGEQIGEFRNRLATAAMLLGTQNPAAMAAAAAAAAAIAASKAGGNTGTGATGMGSGSGGATDFSIAAIMARGAAAAAAAAVSVSNARASNGGSAGGGSSSREPSERSISK